MVSAPPPRAIIMGGLDLKICQNFVGTKFFLTFVGDTRIGGVKIGGVLFSNIYCYTFIIAFIYKQPTLGKVKCFF